MNTAIIHPYSTGNSASKDSDNGVSRSNDGHNDVSARNDGDDNDVMPLVEGIQTITNTPTMNYDGARMTRL